MLMPPMSYNITMQLIYNARLIHDMESIITHLEEQSSVCIGDRSRSADVTQSPCIPILGLIDASLDVLLDIRELPLNPQYSGTYL